MVARMSLSLCVLLSLTTCLSGETIGLASQDQPILAAGQIPVLGTLTLVKQGGLSPSVSLAYLDGSRTRTKRGFGTVSFRNVGGTGLGAAIDEGRFIGFLKDLRDGTIPNKFTWSIVPLEYIPNGGPLTPAKQGALRALYTNHYDEAIAKGAATERLAFSLAVWETIWERQGTSPALGSGPGFRILKGSVNDHRAAVRLANQWVAEAAQSASTIGSGNGAQPLTLYGLVALDSRGRFLAYQDFVVVPEPGTVCYLAGLAVMAAVAGLVRRRRCG